MNYSTHDTLLLVTSTCPSPKCNPIRCVFIQIRYHAANRYVPADGSLTVAIEGAAT